MQTNLVPSSLLRVLMAAAVSASVLSACSAPPSPPAPPPPAPSITSFTVSSSQVRAGAEVTLTWATENAVTVTMTDSVRGIVAGIDSKPAGETTVAVQEDTLFVLTAENANKVQDTAVVSVDVLDGHQGVIFVATPKVTDPGAPVTLAWDAPGAAKVSLVPAGGADIDLGGQLERGSVTVHPSSDTTYVLTVDGEAFQAPVSVRPAVQSFVATPGFGMPGDNIGLSWTAIGGSSLTIQAIGRGEIHTVTDAAQIASGSFTDTLPVESVATGTVVYLLKVESETKALVGSRELTVYIGNEPVIAELNAPPYARSGGTFSLSWKTVGAEQVEVLENGVQVYVTPSSALAAAGTFEWNTPTQPAEYTVRASHPNTGEVTKKVTVSPVGVPPQDQATFTSSPAGTVASGGDPVVLSWNVPNARSVQISAGGTVIHASQGDSVETSTITVYPNADTEYVLTADNTLGDSVTASLFVAVTTPADFTLTPDVPVPAGARLEVSWAVQGDIYGLPHGNIQTPTYEFIDISHTGTKLPFDPAADDQTKSFSPGFSTWMYGQPVTGAVTVSSNGFISIGGSDGTMSVNSALPRDTIDYPFYAPWWDDLIFHVGSGIYWQIVGEGTDRELIVQWDRLKRYNDDASELTFQLRLHPTGMVTYTYKTITVTPGVDTTNEAAVVGLQEGTALRAQVYGGAAPAAGSSLRFFGPVASPVADVQAWTQFPYLGFVKVGDGYLQLSKSKKTWDPRELVVSEVMHSPAAAVAAGAYVELYNRTDVALDLDGWTLDLGSGNTHVLSSANGTTVVPAGGFLVLGQSADPALNDGITVQYAYPSTLQLANSGSVGIGFRGATAASSSWTTELGGSGASVEYDSQLYVDSSAIPHELVCTSSGSFGAQVPQQKGSPGFDGGCFPYRLEPIPVRYYDIAANGGTALFSTATTRGDGHYAWTSLATAPFPYFGTFSTVGTISSNGWVAFSALTTHDGSNDSTPSKTQDARKLVAPFWDDLDDSTLAGNNTYLKRVAAGEDPNSPDPHWVVQWHRYDHNLAAAVEVNVQSKFFDNGVIEFHYGTMTGDTNYSIGGSSTVWIDDGNGTALWINTSDKTIEPNTAYRFIPR
ncbi:MAG: lamin tail domain-containing protein [Myxococcaceae bacterium]